MAFGLIVPFLSVVTLLGMSMFALISKKNVEDRISDPTAPKSTLAKNRPQVGTAFLLPRDEQTRRVGR